MKKILFAISQNADKSIENHILNMYREQIGEGFEFSSEYYLEGVEKALKEISYDILIIREDLERTKVIDREFLDILTDHYHSLNIILIISNEHKKDDYVKSIFNMGIYNILYRDDFTLENVINLIESGRNKIEAKNYLGFGDTQELIIEDEFEEFPEEQLEQCLQSLNNTDDNISDIFNEINRQYTKGQMMFLVTILSDELSEKLSKSNNIVFLNIKSRLNTKAESFDIKSDVKYIEKEKIIKVEKEVIKEVIKPVIIEKTVEKVIKQQVIAFYTTDDNIAKDDILCQLSTLLAKSSEQKILVIDANPINPTLDHFFGIDKEITIKDIYSISEINTGLSAVYNAIEKEIFKADLLEEFVIKHKQYNNLHILTGLYDLDMFETLNKDHYSLLIDKAVEIYDTVLINTNADIAVAATYVVLAKATNVLVISNANYTYARNVNFILNYLINNLNIPKSKFKIIVNNLSKTSLDKDAMDKIFEDYDVLGYIPFNMWREYFLNKRKSFITSVRGKKDIHHYMDIIESLGYIPKTSLIDRLFNRKKYAEAICVEKDGE